jgi:hypothetical protein
MSVYPQPNKVNDVTRRVQLSAGANVVYTCPAGFNATVDKIIIHTPGSNNVSLSIVSDTTVVVYDFSLSADDTLVDSNGYRLLPSEKISISNTSSLSIVIEVKEYYIYAPR